MLLAAQGIHHEVKTVLSTSGGAAAAVNRDVAILNQRSGGPRADATGAAAEGDDAPEHVGLLPRGLEEDEVEFLEDSAQRRRQAELQARALDQAADSEFEAALRRNAVAAPSSRASDPTTAAAEAPPRLPPPPGALRQARKDEPSLTHFLWQLTYRCAQASCHDHPRSLPAAAALPRAQAPASAPPESGRATTRPQLSRTNGPLHLPQSHQHFSECSPTPPSRSPNPSPSPSPNPMCREGQSDGCGETKVRHLLHTLASLLADDDVPRCKCASPGGSPGLLPTTGFNFDRGKVSIVGRPA